MGLKSHTFIISTLKMRRMWYHYIVIFLLRRLIWSVLSTNIPYRGFGLGVASSAKTVNGTVLWLE